MSIFKMAWRNLGRNKRRTLITVSSVFFGVIFSALMGSMQEGSYQKMVENVVRFYAGHAQIQNAEYKNNESINNSFIATDSLTGWLKAQDGLLLLVPRLESYALASSGNQTEGVMVMGVDPELEDSMTTLSDKIIDGHYLEPNGVLVGEKLAQNLNLLPGDTLILLSQGYHGISAAGKYSVAGLFSQPNPELNRRLVYMTLNDSQQLFSATNRITSLALVAQSQGQMDETLPLIRHHLNREMTIRSWQEMFPAVLQQIESDRATAWIMKLILYLVIAFGILGTVVMMMAERKHEFSVMVAIGMFRWRLAVMLLIEIMWIAILGVGTGLIGTFPVIGWFVHHPIPITGQGGQWMENIGFEPYMFFAWDLNVFLQQMLVVFIMTLLLSLYPFARAFKINPAVGMNN
jgi:ABC-type lipoprotein release transport system permease subunit